jgi:hypothetical protein
MPLGHGANHGVPDPRHEPARTATLHYLAILSAARDFGVSAADIERVVHRFHPFQTGPRELADALADTLTSAMKA